MNWLAACSRKGISPLLIAAASSAVLFFLVPFPRSYNIGFSIGLTYSLIPLLLRSPSVVGWARIVTILCDAIGVIFKLILARFQFIQFIQHIVFFKNEYFTLFPRLGHDYVFNLCCVGGGRRRLQRLLLLLQDHGILGHVHGGGCLERNRSIVIITEINGITT